MVGPTGKVVGIDHIQNLVDWSENNLRKNHGNLIDSGQIKLVLGDGRLGYDQDGPYHAIHVGAAAAELPQQVRKFFIFAIFFKKWAMDRKFFKSVIFEDFSKYLHFETVKKIS